MTARKEYEKRFNVANYKLEGDEAVDTETGKGLTFTVSSMKALYRKLEHKRLFLEALRDKFFPDALLP